MKLLMLVVIVALCCTALWSKPAVSFGGWVKVTVEPGDTEWSIGEAHCPQADTRQVVCAIELRNHTNTALEPGQTLWVPTKVTDP
ncbi:MAG: LysM peptidoglycan-binding domain-containing protein [Firmicutes bacterium]|nr:LysM peptidoglycan-binding domain-containing protein [Bacillota bacterium]